MRRGLRSWAEGRVDWGDSSAELMRIACRGLAPGRARLSEVASGVLSCSDSEEEPEEKLLDPPSDQNPEAVDMGLRLGPAPPLPLPLPPVPL